MRGERGGRGDRYHLKLSEHNSYMFLFVWWFSNCSLSFLFLFLQPLGMGPTTMHIHIKGLPPNTVHGFHIHEYGDTFSDGTFTWSNTNKIVTNVLIACGTSLVFPRFSDEQRQAQGEHETNARWAWRASHAPKEKEKCSLTREFSSLLLSDCLLS